MTDPEKPDLEKNVTDEETGAEKPATSAPATPRGKSARRTGSGDAVSDPDPEPQPSAGKKEFSLTVTASGIKRALGALVVVALIAAVGFLGWRT